MSDNRLQLALNRCKDNALNKPYYQADLPMDDLPLSFLRYLNRTKAREIGEQQPAAVYHGPIFDKVPPFQRSNGQWTPDMQSAFVRNVLLGLKPPPIIFYALSNNKGDCRILDGLQRMTALMRFFTDPEMEIAFDDNLVLTAKEILANATFTRMFWNLNVPLLIYQFASEAEAVQHYIEMNEQITHSQADILKAKAYLTSLVSDM